MSVQFRLYRPVVVLLADMDRSHQAHDLLRPGVSETRYGGLHDGAGGACTAKGDEVGGGGFVDGQQRQRTQQQPQSGEQPDPNRDQTYFSPMIQQLTTTPYGYGT